MLFDKVLGVGAVLTALGVGSFALLSAGSQGCSSCDCANPGAGVQLSEQQAPLVSGVAIGGECGATIRCGTGSPCTSFWITPTREGTCRVEVSFDNGAPSFTRDIEFRGGTGCCNGLYPVGGLYPVVLPESAGDAGGG
jgi:hypothetical protein